MKKLITALFCLTFLFYQANAQKWVSTQPENKNVVLEEFTGLHCGYCPDGHRISAELAKANPGRIFPVNIHSGSFANPNAGEPDLRIPEGTTIDGAAKVAGYPAGSVNRSTTPWSMDRNAWASTAAGILSQISPVNVAVKANVDFTTRQLTVEVEFYYIAASNSPTNYLTVYLTQSNIQGYQSDYGNYNPTNWTLDGKYRHNHVLRQVLTSGGAFGEKIDTTTKNHYEYRKFVSTLPANINNIDVILYNLDVVAFVSEGQGNIFSAAGTPVEFDPNLKVDLSLKNLTVFPTNYIFNTINPKVEVTNNSGKTVITGFDVSTIVNGIVYKKTFSGSLAAGDKTTIEWGDVPFTAYGTYDVIIAGFNNVNSNSIVDMDFSNDLVSHSGLRFKSKAFSAYLASFDGTLPSDLALDKSQNTAFIMTTNPVCGADNTTGAIRYALHSSWGVSGKPGPIIFGEADLSQLADPNMYFYYAYSDDAFGGTPPVIKVQASEDGGANWIDLKTITPVQTGLPATHGNWYVPKTTDYKFVPVSLSAYKNKSVMLQVIGIPGTAGNAMYIDEISVQEYLGVNDNIIVNGNSTVYPNPAISEIRLNNDKYLGADYLIYSTIGNVVAKGSNINNKIDITNLNAGSYYFRINKEILKFVKK